MQTQKAYVIEACTSILLFAVSTIKEHATEIEVVTTRS